MTGLFEPLQLKNITFRNRIVVSPMCQYSSVDGFATDWHLVHLGSRAVGGAGLVFSEATAVSPEGRISPDDLGIWKDAHIEKLKQITTFIKQQGAVAGIQLAHAGRKASHQSPWNGGAAIAPNSAGGWQTVAPSAVPFKEGEPKPEALDSAGIAKIIADFKDATQRSLAASFEVIEIHAAHGYLLHQFLSPHSNMRTDAYGGPFENRIRLLLEILSEVQTAWPAYLPLFVRISATDWTATGWNIEDSVQLARILKEKGVDLIDCSSGGNVPDATIPTTPLYQSLFAAQIKKETGIATGAVGLITAAEEGEMLLKNGDADLIFMARQLLREPYFPLQASAASNAMTWPVQYERAKPRS